ncbi:SOS response-associated peptidase family protein [Paracoccus mutanolyticus]|uniref:SOS response-associated peptidase family protein n=1 Tax=Paracoccus mutanolyticus TaxID=1499308 RepID=UPI001675574C|nr:SOS response-associated peptidase family protein [Paracoccus mutanolyticus]
MTNICNTASPHWRRWLGVAHRCVVPAGHRHAAHGLARAQGAAAARDLSARRGTFFAGIWTDWHGTRGSMQTPRPGRHELFAFLTCAPNAVVAAVHPKAMPVILTTPEEIETWLTADWPKPQAAMPLPAAVRAGLCRGKGGTQNIDLRGGLRHAEDCLAALWCQIVEVSRPSSIRCRMASFSEGILVVVTEVCAAELDLRSGLPTSLRDK